MPSESAISQVAIPNGMRIIIIIGDVNGTRDVQNANGELGCGTGRSGTCSACGASITADMHEAWFTPNVVNSNHYEYSGNTANCIKCGKSFVSNVVSNISYNGTTIIGDMIQH